MIVDKVYDEKTGGYYFMFTSPDFEHRDPVKHYSNFYIKKSMILGKELLRLRGIPFIRGIADKFLFKQAREEWEELYEKFIKTEIPENLKNVLTAKRKKDQVKLLRGLTLTSNQLMSFIIYAWQEHGFSFSQYKAEHQRKGLDKKELPTFLYAEGDKVERVGDSKLTDGQLKQAIQQRTVVVAKFFDKGNEWHCFFVTYNSLKGEENWQNGQPHLHYISDKFGIPRDKVVKSLKSPHYNLGSLPHINLTDYGNQPV